VGIKIVEKREAIIKDFNDRIKPLYKLVFDREADLKIKYEPTQITKLLDTESIQREISRKRTLYGVHLDEIEVLEGRCKFKGFCISWGKRTVSVLF